MSLSSDELNYIIWRHLQEKGLEISSYALDDETNVHTLDNKYSKLVPIGCLVDLVQKGILYSKMNELSSIIDNDTLLQDQLISSNFNLFNAIDDSNSNLKNPSTNDVKNDTTTTISTSTSPSIPSTSPSSHHFIKILKKEMTFPPSNSLSFSQKKESSNSLIIATTSNNSLIHSFNSNSNIQLPISPSYKQPLIINYSPNEHYILTACENGTIQLWNNINDNSLYAILAIHHYPIIQVKWSPNSKYILSLDLMNIIIVWDVSSKLPIVRLDKDSFKDIIKENNNDNNINHISLFGTDVCWLDNYKFIIPGPNYSLIVNQLLNNENPIIGKLLGHEDSISFIKYNSNCKLLATSSDDTNIRIFKGNSTNCLQLLKGHSLPITYLTWFDYNENHLILSTSLDGSIRLWNIFENELIDIKYIDDPNGILIANFNNDDNLLFIGDSSGSISVWKISINNIKQIALFQNQLPKGSIISDLKYCKFNKLLAVSYTIGESITIKIDV